MSHSDKSGGGMSRAALKKRKKLNKSLILSAIADNHSGSDQSDDEIPASKKSKSIEKQSSVPSDNILSTYDGCTKTLDYANVTIGSILALKEITEATSKERASYLLGKLLHPIDISEFYDNVWGKRPLFSERNSKLYFGKFFRRSDCTKIFKNHLLLEGEDVQFSDFRGVIGVNGRPVNNDDEEDEEDASQEEVEDEEKPAVEVTGEMIDEKFAASLTVSLLSPQKYHEGLWELLSALEHEFDCRVSAHMTLAPANSVSNDKQYDSADNFILQLEGSCEWTLFAPEKGSELPRASGAPAKVDENGKPIDESKATRKVFTLHLGDTLYIPKGWSYVQSNKQIDGHSLSLKIVTNHAHSHADLLDVLLPQALFEAAQSNVAFRASLPRDYRSFLGVLVSEDEDQKRKRAAYRAQVGKLLHSMVDVALDVLDPAADQLVKKFIGERLPVPMTKEEEALSAAGNPNMTLFPYTKLRMIRPGVAAVFVEDGKCVVYHCMDNTRELHGAPLAPLEFELDDGPAIEGLLRAYPEGVTVSELDHPSEELEDKVGVAQALFREGFLLIDDEASKAAPESGAAAADDDIF